MTRLLRHSWLSLWTRPARAASARPSRRLSIDVLEDRLALSGTPTLDLSSAGAIGSVNGAIFRQIDTQPAGSGVLNSFVRMQSKHDTAGIAQGYNTDARPVQFDEKTSQSFTHALPLSSVPEVNVGGVLYREFLLDVNQTNSTPYMSLDELRIYTGGAPDLTGYNPSTNQLSGINAGYDLGAGNWIKLNSGLNPGSGSTNMAALIPDSAFGGGSYVYLYSKFGVNISTHGGYEEWAVSGSGNGSSSGGTSSGGVINTGGTISGNVFNDLNMNGIQNTGEPGLGGWVVFLDANGDGVLDNNEDWTTTDANGNYSFSNLATGLGAFTTYNVTIFQQYGWTASTPITVSVSLQAPNQSATVNFGEYQFIIGGNG